MKAGWVDTLKAGARPAVVTAAAAGLPVVGVIALGVYGPAIAGWLEAQPAAVGVAVIVLAGAVLCGLALLPTHAVSLAAGYLLGAVAGPGVAWLAVIGASALGYVVGGRLAGPGAVAAMDGHPRFSALRAALLEDSPRAAAVCVGLLRLTPIAPFAATNAALAALRVEPGRYLLGTAVGMGPRIAVVAWLGAGMAELDWQSPAAPGLLVLGVVATVLVLVLIGRAARVAMRRAAAEA